MAQEILNSYPTDGIFPQVKLETMQAEVAIAAEFLDTVKEAVDEYPVFILEFFRFLILKAHIRDFETVTVVPHIRIDTIWRKVILCTELYEKICKRVTQFVCGEENMIHYEPDSFVMEKYEKALDVYIGLFSQFYRTNAVAWPILTEKMRGQYISFAVRTMKGEIITINDMRERDQVESLKHKIFQKTGWPLCHQRLIHKGAMVCDDDRLFEHNIANGSIVHLVPGLRGC